MSNKDKTTDPQTSPEDSLGNKAARSPGDADVSGAAQKKGNVSPPLPAPSFSTFILSLASSTLVQLGEVPDPSTGETNSDLLMAKHTIDTLTMLQDKLQKGLEAEETRLLEGLLYELRMKYIVKK